MHLGMKSWSPALLEALGKIVNYSSGVHLLVVRKTVVLLKEQFNLYD